MIACIGCGWRGGYFGIKKLPNIRSMKNRESVQCSEIVMHLQRMGSRPRVAFETFEKSFLEPSSAAVSKFKLRELDQV